METYFASAEKATEEELKLEIESVSQNPVIDGLMDTVGGLFAVLNEHRQVLALNRALLAMLGLDNIEDMLGLRPGEMLNCIHADDVPGGCGTTRFCPTCGAAIAIVTSLGQNKPVERMCALTVNRTGKEEDLFLRVRSHPITFNGRRLLLLFLQDITRQQQWAALERTFFHDLNNLLIGLMGTSELLSFEASQTVPELHELAAGHHKMVRRLVQEVKMQQHLIQTDSNDYQTFLDEVPVQQIFDELRQLFYNHPVARNKGFIILEPPPELSLRTDQSILMRVLGNMVINAFEASDPGQSVKLWLEPAESGMTFCVWNSQVIPADVVRRVFQRNFSTKQETGRGLGTYSMKLFGEEFLGGKVDFSTSEAEGTTFRFQVFNSF